MRTLIIIALIAVASALSYSGNYSPNDRQLACEHVTFFDAKCNTLNVDMTITRNNVAETYECPYLYSHNDKFSYANYTIDVTNTANITMSCYDEYTDNVIFAILITMGSIAIALLACVGIFVISIYCCAICSDIRADYKKSKLSAITPE